MLSVPTRWFGIRHPSNRFVVTTVKVLTVIVYVAALLARTV